MKMKNTKKGKTWLLYVAMAVLMLASANVFAQFGGFFGTAHGNGEETEREDNGLLGLRGSGVPVSSNGLGNQAFDVDPDPNYSPVGSGVALLMAAGVGYALLKSKKSK